MEETGRQRHHNSKQLHTSPTSNTATATTPSFGTNNITAGSPHNKKSLDTLIGKYIRVRTVLNDDFEGVIYTYDPVTNCIAIDQSTTPNRKNCSFRIIKIANIKEIVSLTDDSASTLTASPRSIHKSPIHPVSIERAKAREASTIREVKTEVSRIGVGVTKEAQDIFNALSKTLPCRWSKDTIIVLDEILIPAPYTPESCKANPSSANLLARVKKVLEGERKRLAKTVNSV